MKIVFASRALAAALAILGVAGRANANATPQALPFSQNWTNIASIAANDDWSGVPGIEGFLGQNITTSQGVDPQTLLTTSIVANDLTVLANQTDPTITNGDVVEFQITNPTIAMQGSSTADAPYVLLHINTTGNQNVTVAYNVRDIDGSADDAIQQVALQYRVGTSGNFTNVPAGYVSDATTGPSIATLVTPVSAVLPAAANNQAEVQIRMITTNAVGSDEFVGIDDINVTGSPIVVLPTLSINDVTVAEGALSTTTPAVFTISLSAPAPAGGVSFALATVDDTATITDNDYLSTSGNLTILEGQTSTTASVTIVGDSTIEPNEQFFVNIANPTNATIADGQGVGGITNDDALRPQLSINDVTVTEGNSGTIAATFTVSSSIAAPPGGLTVTATAADDTATTANGDYVANSAVVTIPATQLSATFTVDVNGDVAIESTEQFFVNLSAPGGTAQIADGQGIGTITNDDFPPTLDIGDISVVEGNSGTATLVFPLTLSAPAPLGGVAFTVNTANGTATAPSDYTAIVGGSGGIAAGLTSGSVSVTVNGDTAFEANETLTVTLSAPSGATIGDGVATGTITNDDTVEIHDIQGNGAASPFAGQPVTTLNNVVTGVGTEGFTMQAPDARADADPNTSEGIYVFTASAPTVAIGDLVNVTGTATEFFNFTEITTPVVVTFVSSGNPLPTAVEFDATRPSPDPNNLSCTATQTNFECFEAMRVHVADGMVNTGNQRFASPAGQLFAEVFVSASGRRGIREPGILFPILPTAGNMAAGQWDGNADQFELDADFFGAVPVDTAINGGSTFSATGVIGYDFGNYELWPTQLTITQAAVVPRPVRDSGGNAELRIGAFNMFRFCDTTSDADQCVSPVPTQAVFDAKVARLAAYIEDVLKLPDVVGAVEVENIANLTALAAKIQTDTGVAYSAHLMEGNDIGGIDVGFLVRTSRVTVGTITQIGKTTTWNDPTGSPTALLNDRPPLLLEATFTGGGGNLPFAVMVVHPKARSCTDQTGGATCTQADVDRNRLKRFTQSQFHANAVQAFQNAHVGVPIAVVGDFNAYQFTDGWADVVGGIEGIYDDAANLLDFGPNIVVPRLWDAVRSLPENELYSFLFTENFGAIQGNTSRNVPTQQVLDHALLSTTARAMFTHMDFGRASNDAPNETERLCGTLPTPAPPACPHPSIGVSDHDGFVVGLATDRIFAHGFEAVP